jgi:hypothetical protein
MEIKLTCEGAIVPTVDSGTNLMCIKNPCTTPFAIKFADKNEMVRLIRIIANACEKGNDIIILNSKDLDCEAFVEELKGADKPKHDEEETARIPKLMPAMKVGDK